MDTHKIMIVDDDPHICEIVQAYCEREGFITSYCHSGTEAMKLMASFEPDLIVLGNGKSGGYENGRCTHQ